MHGRSHGGVRTLVLLMFVIALLSACNMPTADRAQATNSGERTSSGGVGESRNNPIPLGKEISIPGWHIQALEFLRGQPAADLLNSGSRTFDPPPEGYEYALVKFFLRCTAIDDSAHSLSLSELFITGDSSLSYTDRIDGWPQPEFLFEDMYSAEAVEGWIDGLIPIGETHPMAVLDLDLPDGHLTRFFALTDDERGIDPLAGKDFNPNSVGSTVDKPARVGEQAVLTDWAITIDSTVRGDQAMAMLRQNDPNYDGPEAGFEYVLLELTVDYFNPIDQPVLISDRNFYAVDETGSMIERGRIRYPGDVAFNWINRIILPGASLNGWVIVNIPEGAASPLIVFDPGEYTGPREQTEDKLRYFVIE